MTSFPHIKPYIFLWFFFSAAIRSHILQWVNEKNRKLTDGFDFEVLEKYISLLQAFTNSYNIRTGFITTMILLFELKVLHNWQFLLGFLLK